MTKARRPGDRVAIHSSEPQLWLIGGGEMGELIRTFDWGKTPLGELQRWPVSFRSTLGVCLDSGFPIGMAWGREQIQLYNDAYVPLLGQKHPVSLGRSFRDCWKTAWPELEGAFERAWRGETTYVEDKRVFLDRHGGLEEAFLTFSFSPIRDEWGDIGGVLHPVIETTAKVLLARRQRVLRELAVDTAHARSALHAQSLALQTLERAGLDVPFALFYSVDADGSQATLTACTAQPDVERCAPTRVALAGAAAASSWPLRDAIASRKPVIVRDLRRRFGVVGSGPYDEAPTTAVVLPISRGAGEPPHALLVAAASPRSPLSSDYVAFFELLAAGVSISMQSAVEHDEQRRRTEQLAELDRSKTVFFSNVSHEFRTPLSLLVGPLEEELAEREQPLPEPRKQRLEVARRSALRLLQLVDTLLEFSRLESGRARARYEPTELSALTSDLIGMFRSAVERAGLSLEVALEPLPEQVYVDRDMWEKIVLNLMSNAFKYTFEGGITVRMRAVEHAVELSVSDTGVGIASGELGRLFERFYRVSGARARSREGAGIGLSLVRELARLHGGEARVESQLGRGTTFTISIPRGRAHLPAEQVSHAESGAVAATGAGVAAYVEEALQGSKPSVNRSDGPPADGSSQRRHKVLVADDNADMREYIARLLGAEFEVLCVGDGEAALEAVASFEPELILSDVMMPRRDGFELLRALRADERWQRLPVILLSARAGEDATVEGLETGADDYLTKPFASRELRTRVRTHLELARLRREWGEHFERANEELEAFSYSVAHDLRTPLRAIDGFSKAVLARHADQLDEQARGYLRRVRAAAARMGELIDELLNLSRVAMAPLHRQLVSLTELAEQLLGALREREPQRRVAVRIEPELLVHADPALSRVVLENLLENAWKFTAKKPAATLTLGRIPGVEPATFFVKDDGAGFDAAYAHRLFQPFQRLHHERDFAGTGVGLAIVKRVVARHGGRVWAEGQVDRGATFYFTLSGTAGA